MLFDFSPTIPVLFACIVYSHINANIPKYYIRPIIHLSTFTPTMHLLDKRSDSHDVVNIESRWLHIALGTKRILVTPFVELTGSSVKPAVLRRPEYRNDYEEPYGNIVVAHVRHDVTLIPKPHSKGFESSKALYNVRLTPAYGKDSFIHEVSSSLLNVR